MEATTRIESTSTSMIKRELCVEGMSSLRDAYLRDSSLPGLAPMSDTSNSSIDTSSRSLGLDRGMSDDNEDAFSEESSEEDKFDRLPQIVEAEAWIQNTPPSVVSPTEKTSRSLSWGVIEMRIYPIIPGDHPDTWQGPPVRLSSILAVSRSFRIWLTCFTSVFQLTIGWKPIGEFKENIDIYEAKRKPRKEESDLRIGWLERRRILRKVGAEEEDIAAALKSSYEVRKQRIQTASPWRLKFARLEEIHESIGRSLSKTFHPKRWTKVVTKY